MFAAIFCAVVLPVLIGYYYGKDQDHHPEYDWN